jgi:2-phospho-L-lactate guanylyltransferase
VKKANVFAIVPVKDLVTSKERLAPVLSPEERRALTASMLEDVLSSLKSSTVNEVVVVSSDSTVLSIADKHDLQRMSPKRQELIQALMEAIQWCIRKRAKSVLILPADIPLVSPNDINCLVELGCHEKTMVLSPSMDGGTNALLLHPPDLVPVLFGMGSFFKHLKRAIDCGVNVKFYTSRGIMLDVDSPEDLSKLMEIERDFGFKQSVKEIRLFKKKGL